MSILDIFVFLPVITLLILSRATDNENVFDRDTTSTLRGIAIIWIIINHIQGQSAFGGSPLLTYIGYWATGLFFFISGYGNTLSMNKKTSGKLSTRWLLNKIKKIYIPYFVGYWLCFFCKLFFLPKSIPTIKKMIIELIILDLPDMTIWFTKIITLCFLLHWISKKLFSRFAPKYVFYPLFISLCLYIISAIKLNAGSEWYSSVICYAIGLLVAINKDNIVRLFENRKKRYVYLIAFCVLFIIAFLLKGYIYYSQILHTAMFSIICFAYTALFRVKTRFLSFIGNNSFEFFVLHFVCLKSFYNLILINKYLYVFSVMAGSIVIVFVYVNIKKSLIKGR